MQSKFFLVLLLGLLSQNILAEGRQENAGFYVGPSLAVSHLLGDQKLTYFNNAQGLYGAKFKGHHATFSWGGMVGHHLPIQEKNFIDLEVYYLNQNNQANFTLDNNGFMYASTYLKKKYTYGAAVSLGMVLYDAEGQIPLSGYIRLGLEKGALENKRTYDGNEYFGQTFKGSKTFTSFAPGIGLKLTLSKNSFLKFGYTYSLPNTYNIHLPYLDSGGGYYNHKFRFSEQRLELSLAYQF